MPDIATTIRKYILESYLPDVADDSFRNDEDLLMVLDSLQILRMLLDLETKYSIKIDNSELTPENLGTVDLLAAYIGSKCEAGGNAPQA